VQESAELGRQFGAEFVEAEAIRRFGHLMPIHLLSREDEKVVALRRRLESQILHLRGLPRAAARMALGRVLLLMGSAGEAKKALEAAQEAGLKDPQLDLALAETYLELWSDEEYQSAVSLSGEALAQARRRLVATYLNGAQRLIAGKDAPVVQFRLALARKDEQTASRWKAEALAREPCAYEVQAHEAHAITIRGMSELAEGRFEAALGRMEQLKPGSAEVRFLRAKEEMARIFTRLDRGPVPGAEMETLRQVFMEAGQGALNCRIEALFLAGTLRELEIQGRLQRGEDAGPVISAMASELEAGLAQVGESADLLGRLALAYQHQAEADLAQGRDALPAYAKAVDGFHRVLKANPGHLEAKLFLANVLVACAEVEQSRGLDPRPRWTEAEALVAEGENRSPGAARNAFRPLRRETSKPSPGSFPPSPTTCSCRDCGRKGRTTPRRPADAVSPSRRRPGKGAASTGSTARASSWTRRGRPGKRAVILKRICRRPR
jgi:tetratricopeptide (TPR) repeat protein